LSVFIVSHLTYNESDLEYRELRRTSYVALRVLRGTSAHVLIPLVSTPIALLSLIVRTAVATELIPCLAALAGLTVIEYGKQTYVQLFYSMLISGALPRHFNSFKFLCSLIISTAVSLATVPSGRLYVVLLTFALSLTLSIALLTYYIRKTKETCRAVAI
jgi:hypothetical protein